MDDRGLRCPYLCILALSDLVWVCVFGRMDEETLDQYLDYIYSTELDELDEALASIQADLNRLCCHECARIQRPMLKAEQKTLLKRRARLMRHL